MNLRTFLESRQASRSMSGADGFWWKQCRQMQLLTCSAGFRVWCVGAVAVHSVGSVGNARKLVTGSEHGVRRPRGFRFGGGQQSLRF
jgi:hypothetical protein